MISSINEFSYKMLRYNKGKFILTLLSIMISSTLVAGLYTVISNISTQFNDGNLNIDEKALKVYLIIFSILIIIVSVLIIKSNFQVILYKYTNELSVLKSIGATPTNCFNILLTQFTVINFLGVILGLIGTIVFNKYILMFMAKLMDYELNNYNMRLDMILLIMAVIFILLQLGICLVSYEVKRLLPKKINKNNERLSFKLNKTRKTVSIILIVIGLGSISNYINSGKEDEFLWVALGNISVIIGTTILIPYIFTFLIRKLSNIVRKCSLNNIFIALENLLYNVKRNSIMIQVITIIVTLGVFIFSFFPIIKMNEHNYIKSRHIADIIVDLDIEYKDDIQTEEEVDSIFDASEEVLKEIRGIDNTNVYGLYNDTIPIKINNKIEMPQVIFVSALHDNIYSELPEYFNVKDKLIISKNFADKYNFKVDDSMQFMGESKKHFTENEEMTLENRYGKQLGKKEIGNICDVPIGYGEIIINDSQRNEIKNYPSINKILIYTNNVSEVKEKLKDVKKNHSINLKYTTLEDELIKSDVEYKAIYGVFITTIGSMLICAILGVCNMFFQYINSKRKEFAILRAISLRRGNLLKIILSQITIYILFSTMIGAILGSTMACTLSLTDSNKLIYINFYFLVILTMILLIGGFFIAIYLYNDISKNKLAVELKEEE